MPFLLFFFQIKYFGTFTLEVIRVIFLMESGNNNFSAIFRRDENCGVLN